MGNIILSIILGIIQGITEWLPISSTGHLILFEKLWSMNNPTFFEMFKVVIQLGSILAICVLYYHRLNPWDKLKSASDKHETFNLWGKIIVGCIPAGVMGLLLNDLIDSKLSEPYVIAITLILYGIAFIVLESHPHRPSINRLEDVSYKTAFEIGCFQTLALIPGTSRSGATILGGSILGCSRKVASEYSFFLAIPVMFGATMVKMIKFGFNYTGMEVVMLVIATFVSFIVSIFAVRFLLNYIRQHDFKIFGYYRIVLGILVVLFFYIL